MTMKSQIPTRLRRAIVDIGSPVVGASGTDVPGTEVVGVVIGCLHFRVVPQGPVGVRHPMDPALHIHKGARSPPGEL